VSGRPHRLHRRPRREADAPPPEVERYFGPATVEVVSARGSWAPRVDTVGLGFDRDRGTLEVALLDGEVRPTLPWWLRTTPDARLTLHGVVVRVDAPTVRHRGHRTVLRWTVASDALRAVLQRTKRLPAMFTPLIEAPPGPEERAVLRDYLLSTDDERLAAWF